MPRRSPSEERPPTAVAFGSAIRDARNRRDESLEDVAGRVPKLDPRYLGEVELGFHAPTIVTAKKIADALEVPLTELMKDL